MSGLETEGVAGVGGGGSAGMAAAPDVDVGGPLIAGPAGRAEGIKDEGVTTLMGTRGGSFPMGSGMVVGIAD